jgi:hypothetical protein
MTAAFRIPFTVSGAHVRLMVRRGPDFDALVRASNGAVEFVGDTARARSVLMRLLPRGQRETAQQRDHAGSGTQGPRKRTLLLARRTA